MQCCWQKRQIWNVVSKTTKISIFFSGPICASFVSCMLHLPIPLPLSAAQQGYSNLSRGMHTVRETVVGKVHIKVYSSSRSFHLELVSQLCKSHTLWNHKQRSMQFLLLQSLMARVRQFQILELEHIGDSIIHYSRFLALSLQGVLCLFDIWSR